MTQVTISDLEAVSWVATLNHTQQRILKLLGTGDHTQSQIAERLKVSRQYVNSFVQKLLSKHLIRRSVRTPSNYNAYYELIPHLAKQIDDEIPNVHYSECRVHNIRLKYTIVSQSREVSSDKRTGYFLSWQMRGGIRHKFIIPARCAGLPDITIDVHPNTIVAYPNAEQAVYAESIDEAEKTIIQAVHEAVHEFLNRQNLFGCKISIENPAIAGKLISKIHYAQKLLKDSPFARTQTCLPDFWIDNSLDNHGESEYAEFETDNKAAASALDRSVSWLIDAGRAFGRNPFAVIFEKLERIERQTDILIQISSAGAAV